MTISLAAIRLNPHPLTAAEISAAFNDYTNDTILPEEGGYSDDDDDAGGETNWGITKQVAVANGFTSDMRTMTKAEAIAIYRINDWQKPGHDQLAAVNLPLAIELYDLGVNMGEGTATKFLQSMLQVLGFYSGVIDGQLGPMSCAGVAQFLALRGKDGLRVLFCGVRAAAATRYIAIVQANPVDKKFIYGWLVNRAFPEVTA